MPPILKPPCHLINVNRCYKDWKTRSTKVGHENLEKSAGGKNKGTCAPDQGSGAPYCIVLNVKNVLYTNAVHYSDIIK